MSTNKRAVPGRDDLAEVKLRSRRKNLLYTHTRVAAAPYRRARCWEAPISVLTRDGSPMRDTWLAQSGYHKQIPQSLIRRVVSLDFENLRVTHFIRARTRDAAARIADAWCREAPLWYSRLPARRCAILG